MTARERAVVVAIVKAITTGDVDDMDALATSYRVGERYNDLPLKRRAAVLLQQLVNGRWE